MSNQDGSGPSLADLDLSGIEGLEGFTPNGAPSAGSGDAIDASQHDNSGGAVTDAGTGANTGDAAPRSAIEWSQLMERIPEPLHEEIRPMLSEYERQYERLNEQLSPFKRFVEQGVSQADIQLALNIHEAMITDPKRFYDSLGETYGWNQQQQQWAMQQAAMAQRQQAPQQIQQRPQQANGDGFSYEDFFEPDGSVSPGVDPQLAQILMEQQQKLDLLLQAQVGQLQQQQQYEQQMREQQMREVGRQEMESEMAQLQQKYGDFDKAEVVKRAFANANAGRNPTLTQAFHELRDYEQRVLQRQAAQRPPVVLGSGNGAPPAAPRALTTEDERRAAALELAVRLGANAPGQFQ